MKLIEIASFLVSIVLFRFRFRFNSGKKGSRRNAFTMQNSNHLARLMGNNRFLVVMSQSIPRVLFSTVTVAFPADNRAPIGQWPTSRMKCVLILIYAPDLPCNQWRKIGNKNRKLHVRGNLKSRHSLIHWGNVLKMYENPFKLHILDLSSVATNYQLGI